MSHALLKYVIFIPYNLKGCYVIDEMVEGLV